MCGAFNANLRSITVWLFAASGTLTMRSREPPNRHPAWSSGPETTWIGNLLIFIDRYPAEMDRK